MYVYDIPRGLIELFLGKNGPFFGSPFCIDDQSRFIFLSLCFRARNRFSVCHLNLKGEIEKEKAQEVRPISHTFPLNEATKQQKRFFFPFQD